MENGKRNGVEPLCGKCGMMGGMAYATMWADLSCRPSSLPFVALGTHHSAKRAALSGISIKINVGSTDSQQAFDPHGDVMHGGVVGGVGDEHGGHGGMLTYGMGSFLFSNSSIALFTKSVTNLTYLPLIISEIVSGFQ